MTPATVVRRFPFCGSPRARLACLLAALGCALAPQAHGSDLSLDPEREEDYVRVVQKQAFTRGGRFAIAPTFSLTTNDPLLETYTAGAQMTYYARDWIGVTFGGFYAFDSRRGAAGGLLDQQLRPDLNPMKWGANLGVEWVPIYGKFALFNRGIIHWDAYLVAAAGVVNTSLGGIAPAGIVGAGSRLFVTAWMSVFFEVRDILYNESFKDSDAKDRSNFLNNLMFGVGVSFFFPSRVAR